jgi:hypothetical protein
VIGVFDDVEVEVLFEIRQLAVDMIRLEGWARDASERRRFDRLAELQWQRELAMERRSRLMRELWRDRHPYRDPKCCGPEHAQCESVVAASWKPDMTGSM